MNVHGTGNQHAWMKANHVELIGNTSEKNGKTAQTEVTPLPVVNDEQEGRGVIRLLQAGHFQGVADVRLRINFHDELQQAAAQNAANDFQSASTGLLDELSAKLGVLGEEHGMPGQAEELSEAFSADIRQLLEDAKAKQTPLSSTLENISARFSELLESLHGTYSGLISPAAPQEPIVTEPELAGLLEDEDALTSEEQATEQMAANPDEVLTEEPGGEIAVDEDSRLAAFKVDMQELDDWFTQSLAELHGEVTAASELPPLSEPRGNGAAYAKFLEIYRSMNAGGEVPGAQPEAPAEGLVAEI